MKFLENEKLAQLTAQMTDAVVGTGECVINGRIEAFTMKRAGTDKKLAHELGEKYQAEIQVVESEMAEYERTFVGRMRSNSLGSWVPSGIAAAGADAAKKEMKETSSSKRKNLVPFQKKVRIDTSLERGGKSNGRRRSNSVGIPVTQTQTKTKRKGSARSCSQPFDQKKGNGTKSILKTRSNSNDSTARRSRSDSFLSSDLLYSSLGDFHDSCTQRLMTDLILTLNASFPDYDFSSTRPSHFTKLSSQKVAINRTNEKLGELNKNGELGTDFLSQLWNAINEVISMNESEVYSYVPPQRDDDDDPLGFLTQTLDGADTDKIVPLWTLNFFFVNKSKKRIVLFTCVQTMRNNDDDMIGEEEDDGYVESMDEVKEVMRFDNFGMARPLRFRSSRESSALEDSVDEEDDEQSWNDFDVDTDVMGQPAPRTTVA